MLKPCNNLPTLRISIHPQHPIHCIIPWRHAPTLTRHINSSPVEKRFPGYTWTLRLCTTFCITPFRTLPCSNQILRTRSVYIKLRPRVRTYMPLCLPSVSNWFENSWQVPDQCFCVVGLIGMEIQFQLGWILWACA